MVNSRKEYIKGIDGKDIFLRIWDKVNNPRAVLQIFHGMAEHSERYDDFAGFLNSKGVLVYADDHRGHGYSHCKDKKLGYLGDDGFNNIVEDERIISKIIKDKYDLPLFIFAHSFGSFIGQEYIIRYSHDINGIILSGSAKQDGMDVKIAKILASLEGKIFDDNREAHLIDSLSFGSYNNKIEDKRSKFDWLTRDRNQVDKYIDDPFCGFISPINFYYNFFHGLSGLYRPERLEKIRKDLSFLIISGDMDPVGKYGKSVKRLYEQYESIGMAHGSLKLYEGGRHELLNETNKDQVYEYIHSWIKKHY